MMDDTIAERYELGDAWKDGQEVVELDLRAPLDKIVPIRLTADVWDALRAEARELGIGPSTLARMWIIERLRERVSRVSPPTTKARASRVRKRISSTHHHVVDSSPGSAASRPGDRASTKGGRTAQRRS